MLCGDEKGQTVRPVDRASVARAPVSKPNGMSGFEPSGAAHCRGPPPGRRRPDRGSCPRSRLGGTAAYRVDGPCISSRLQPPVKARRDACGPNGLLVADLPASLAPEVDPRALETLRAPGAPVLALRVALRPRALWNWQLAARHARLTGKARAVSAAAAGQAPHRLGSRRTGPLRIVSTGVFVSSIPCGERSPVS